MQGSTKSATTPWCRLGSLVTRRPGSSIEWEEVQTGCPPAFRRHLGDICLWVCARPEGAPIEGRIVQFTPIWTISNFSPFVGFVGPLDGAGTPTLREDEQGSQATAVPDGGHGQCPINRHGLLVVSLKSSEIQQLVAWIQGNSPKPTAPNCRRGQPGHRQPEKCATPARKGSRLNEGSRTVPHHENQTTCPSGRRFVHLPRRKGFTHGPSGRP